MKLPDLVGLTEAFFLLFLAIAGNFLGETMGCKTQFYLSKKPLLKQLVLFLMIYFTTNFTSTKTHSPKTMLKRTLLLWIVFIIFAKMPPAHTFIVIMLAICIYTINNYKKYLATQKDKTQNKQLEKYQQILMALIGLILLIGFVTYYKAKRLEYGRNFKFTKFIFGIQQCKSMQ